MYYGYCRKNNFWTPKISLPTPEQAWRYAVLHRRFFNEVRIVDKDDYCVIHVQDGSLIFPQPKVES